MSEDVVQVTVPDLARLWRVVQRLNMAQVDALIGGVEWRISPADWAWIRQHAAQGGVGVGVGGRSTLFGVPVEVLPSRLFPELVLVVDRRD